MLADALPLVTAREARLTGMRVSTLHRVRSGVYTPAAVWLAAPAWARYRTRVAAYLIVNPSAVLCLESAAVAHGLPLFGEPRDIHVFDPDRTSSRRFADVCVHTSRVAPAIVRGDGWWSTSLADTVVDLVRVLPPAQALAVADAAISPRRRAQPLDRASLTERAAERPGRRGSRRAEWVWPRMDGLSESVAESLSRAVIEWCGFETPLLQQEFRIAGHRDRADFFFPQARVVGEADG